MIKAVVFDLDGTLLNTLGDLTRACNYAISKFGYDTIKEEDTRRFIGNGIRNYILLATGNDLEHIDAMYQSFREYYQVHCNDATFPYPGITELLGRLKSEGYHLGCVSNKAIYALSILCDAHFKDMFDVILGDQCGFERKPNPEIIKETGKRMGVSMDEMVYIGDSDVDVKTVMNAGCRGIFVSYGYRDKEILVSLGAGHIAEDASLIYNMIKEMDKHE